MEDIVEKKPTPENNQDSLSVDNGYLKDSLNTPHEGKLVRKIDLVLMPVMLVAYMLAFIDKQTLNSSAIMGIKEDLNLHGSQYSWASSIFYFGYLVASYPVSVLLVKFPLGKYLSITFILWAIVLACHAATESFAGIMCTRFFLGFTEASLSPGFNLITSIWYRTSEQPLRHGLWFCGNSISFIIGNLITIGVWKIESNLASWRWLFIIFGLVTFFWGLVMLFVIPDSPASAKFLSEEEKLLANERLRANQAGYKSNKLDRGQIVEAVVDYKTWMLALYVLGCNIPNGGFTAFSSQILQGFGFSTTRTLLLGMPAGAVMLVAVILSCLASSKFKNSRCVIMAVVNCISIIGCALIYATSSMASRYAGLLLMGVFSAGLPLAFAMISSNVGGFTKRATVGAVIFIAYCAGNIIGPQIFFEREAPKYESGFLGTIICFVFTIVDSVLLGFLLRRENRRRDRVAVSASGLENEGLELVDITDFQNMQFRYAY
ncbi:hypothetical protein ASPWEDRAFT_168283 [Aspergillus wentii DTO 134E9]|uniref:Major facilitator superfamily (MFS) profile domain-containing protein n=1 Tax=Aspergillus wentii DTO 134E9 TaxID=1073089 RepID=A0A1L9RTT8_ASPWE|nr:uncharacterized protein ASPWEDRAFT_168283 [Aspergillus wentii DTO 134E9]OJJ38371.1 hypothetical protein ASPWEDRAFT_168283 [Aspergillus wentii DTO 134E9]